jgi:uncharacterized protein with GYD domain
MHDRKEPSMNADTNVAAAGNVRTKTMRAFDADQMTDIIARTS